MLDWQDFYGGDISASDEIKKAKTNKQLSEILDRHEAYMEDMLNDAKMHLKQFRTDIGLSWL
jgi:hypothetical protein